MSSANLPGPGDPGASLPSPNATTWLVDAEAAESLAHFVEVDALDPTRPLAVMQPARPLRHGTRHVVAVAGAIGPFGERLPQTPGFAELLEAMLASRETPVRPELRQRANHFREHVFPALRRAGFRDDLSEIQLAWDFITASEEGQLGTLREMREAARSWLDRELLQEGNYGSSGSH
ncbi:unnamed protein product, partial [Discosporangium mesarthrocarpum]